MEYVYLAIAAFMLYEGIRLWGDDRSKSYMLLAFAALAVFMYFFKRRFRQKYYDKNK